MLICTECGQEFPDFDFQIKYFICTQCLIDMGIDS
jgi:hypothetical protein